MQCTWDASLLRRGDELPHELLHVIQHGQNNEYLAALTTAALDARYTYIILTHCEDLLPHLCASLRTHGSLPATIAALGRMTTFAKYLTPYATNLLLKEHYRIDDSSEDEEDQLFLLGLFRLLLLDNQLFSQFISPHQLASQLGRKSRPVTYLILRILQIYLQAADDWFEKALRNYLGGDDPDVDIAGTWDEKVIDYRFLSLWEEQLHDHVSALRCEAGKASSEASQSHRVLLSDIFHPSTAMIGGILLPLISPETASPDSTAKLVLTPTISDNLASLALSLRSSRPILLSGLGGSGKSMLIRHAARCLGKLDRLVTLHLNEQSDAKILLGIHTTGETAGSFVWKPGVLTTAVRDGRWVLIEDLDRAPNEVLGTLLPLIERRELFIPSRKETVSAAEGFRILATVRSSVSHQGVETKPLMHMLGMRHWQQVSTAMPSAAEHMAIARDLFPSLAPLLPQFLAVFERLSQAAQQTFLMSRNKTGAARSISPRDLLKWCQRVSGLLEQKSSFTSADNDAIFLEAIDCFLAALSDDMTKFDLAAIVAEELRIDPQRRDHLLTGREVSFKVNKNAIAIGRYQLPAARQMKASQSSFSANLHTAEMLERVAAAVLNKEPLLLVGETGVGKTTAVQYLASTLGKKLVPFNLSQQSEVSDLLGGFKPVNARTLIIPMKDDFDELFAKSFSATKNKPFLELLGKQMAKGNWRSVCKLWRQALNMVDQQRAASPGREGEAPNKKRKVDGQQTINFSKWDAFASRVQSLERQLSGNTDAFAFTFVEGNIVKAVRNGDWVLLDEINLASSDTLESLADLLDAEHPSLLLTEAGSIDRIGAHPDFRIFAAMNPATDVGKKDLPPGIRSRFTELYVGSPDKDIKSLQSIVRAYLRQESASDTALASDVSLLYQRIIALASENKLVDGAGQRPHFSLRTLTRTLSYAKFIQHSCSTRRALFEGFQMSFLTFLDAESATLVQPVIAEHLFGKRISVKAELQKALRKPDNNHSYVQGHPGSKHWLRQGTLAPQEQPQYIITPFVAGNLENLVRAASTRQFPVLIQGPTSSGKTSMIEYLAKRSGHIFTRVNNHEHTDLQEYLGSYVSDSDGRLHFQEGILINALREGHWLVLDELNLAPTDVLEALNRLLDDNRELLIPETQEVVRPHPDFMLFATQNPAGLYGGRKTLSRAFRNRFLELHFDDIPVDELQEILHRRTLLPESRCRRIVRVYKELSILRQENRIFEQNSFATLRDLFRWALRQNDTIDDLAINGFMLLCERVRKPEERIALKAVIERAMSEKGPRVQIDDELIYSDDSPELLQYKQRAASGDVVWTKAMRRLYVLVARAVQNNEPVLLVGETGCGKTTVCQMIAKFFEKPLHTVNAHQNTETGDLIGSQRPVRNRGTIELALRQLVLSSPLIEQSEDVESLSTEALLRRHDNTLSALSKDEKTSYLQTDTYQQLRSTCARFKALFEWADGSLITAMREGSLFLLDEISLADDSVLERINSVLEPQRTILLAEKGSLDAFVTATPGFQFLATMNPGGDFGKRELSPALRNRFTEIWVPALSDMNDVRHIVRGKLASAFQHLAEPMVTFSSWFKTRYDTSASPSVSIRDTLAWCEFINSFGPLQIESAVVHGAAMVYIDTLGANPAGFMSLTSLSLDQERQACLQELGHLLEIDAAGSYAQELKMLSSREVFGFGPFTIPRTRDTTKVGESTFTFEASTTRTNAMRVLRALQLSKPIMLEGSPGVGKTALVGALANAVGMHLTRINLSDQTDLLDLFGSDAPSEAAQTGTFVWKDAPFLRAMKRGEWVLLDEMNLASQSILEGLNACLDHRGEVFVPELGQTFSRHPDFRLFAAQNPHHQGGGRKGLPASFVNRFTVVYADSFRAQDLLFICRRTFPDVGSPYLEQAVSFIDTLSREVTGDHAFGAQGGPWEFNLRDLARWLTLASSRNGLLGAATSRDLVDMLFKQRFRAARDRSRLDQIFESIFEAATPLADQYYSLTTRHLQVGTALLARDALSSNGAFCLGGSGSFVPPSRVLQSIMLCVLNSWPLVLSGASASGKTRTIELLAQCLGTQVVTLAMSADTDTLDLIGGYEQHDPHRQNAHCMHQLSQQIQRFVKLGLLNASDELTMGLLCGLHNARSGSIDTRMFMDLLRRMPSEIQVELLPLLQRLQQSVQTIDQARFEWIDGPLVDALQTGKWLVLDNANLCSASVLDRLNSLLEPNGSLIVNEHSTEDGSPRIIRPHPSFRIFLTVNPQYGELSRAMRNRAVELYLVTPDNVHGRGVLQCESAMARLHLLKDLELENGHIAAVLHDHFSLSDNPLLPRLQRQLEKGLFSSSAASHKALELSYPPTRLDSLVQDLYRDISSFTQMPADFACVQSFHPLNNQPLVQQSPQFFLKALFLAVQYDFHNVARMLGRALTSIKSDRKLTDRLARFWKTSAKKPRAHGLLELVDKLLQVLTTRLPQIEFASLADGTKARVHLGGFMSFCWNLVHAIESGNIDMALLSAFNAVGGKLVNAAMSSDLVGATLSDLCLTFKDTLDQLGPISVSPKGRNYVALWKRFRPAMPVNIEALRNSLRLEDVIDRFDQVSLTSELPLAQLLELRLAFQQAMKISQSVSDEISPLVQRVAALVPEDQQIKSPEIPHFADVFELLCQCSATWELSGTLLQPFHVSKLEVLAGRKTTRSMGLYTAGGDGTEHQKLGLLGLTLPNSPQQSQPAPCIAMCIIQRLSILDEISLRNLSLLEAETRTLGQTMAAQSHLLATSLVSNLKVCLKDLLHIVQRALENSTAESAKSAPHGQLIALSHDPLQSVDAILVPQEQSDAAFQHVAQYLRSSSLDLQNAADAWTSFAMSCLEMYIPEQAYDPVQESIIGRKVYLQTRDTITAKLSALLRIRETWAGEPQSLRARLLRQELETLGTGPVVEEICRPANSQITQLHNDFEMAMRILAPLRHETGASLDDSSWDNLAIVRDRLSKQYRPYADLTSPVVGFLNCLFTARRLRYLAASQTPTDDLVTSRITPVVGAELHDWLSDEYFLETLNSCRSRKEQLYWLSVLAQRRATLHAEPVNPELQSAIGDTFSKFYEAWRVELSKDQKTAAAKSSLYHYRQDDDDSEETTQQQLNELFPDSEENTACDTKSGQDSSAQVLAPVLATLFHAHYGPYPAETADLTQAFGEWRQLATVGEINTSLPVILCSLDGLAETLSEIKATKSLNIYRSGDINQSKVLMTLVKRVRTRFESIHIAWPEHATPLDVIRCCDEILAMSYAKAVSHFFQPVEKLHATINEWQKIASSEYSAAALLEDTTSLIVSWRQMELSTWAGMFDFEDQSCCDHAASWWYIAYESIVRGSEAHRDEPDSLCSFSRSLTETLSEFLANCGLGEYCTRLSMLRNFSSSMRGSSTNYPTLAIVHNAITNLTAFYSRFEVPVKEILSKKRIELEKEIKNVIQVASWKDRNIETLKQSAKASHRKLFKTVRKYRQLLSQPVAPILQSDFPFVSIAQAKTMKPATLLKIDSFLHELDDECAELRKATPGIVTDKNKALVQHLKTRKRRLFADVLRDVKLMGFQTNMSEDVLNQQQSLPQTLAQSSHFTNHRSSELEATAEQEMHRLLHIMPTARASAVKHSEDLTAAEVARSKVLLENMLEVIIGQSRAISQDLVGLQLLESASAQISAMCNSSSLCVINAATINLTSRTSALYAMLQASAKCVQAQGRLADRDYTQAQSIIASATNRIAAIRGMLGEQADLPIRIGDRDYELLESRFVEVVATLATDVRDLFEIDPELEPTLRSLVRWANDAIACTKSVMVESDQRTISIHAWTQQLLRISELMNSHLTAASVLDANQKNRKTWLVEEQQSMVANLQALQLNIISMQLRTLLSQLHDVKLDDQTSLTGAVAACREVWPVLEAYLDTARILVNGMTVLQGSMSKLAYKLASYFLQLTRQGFCQPPEKSQDNEEQSGQVETGTGLGDGEGGEDISKDIGNDEDLSELAQDAGSKDSTGETEAEKDAVDMADEDLEGEFDADVEQAEGEGDDDEEREEDADVDEEAGHVDDADPGTVDEKTWNDEKAEAAEKEADNGRGIKNEDVSAAAEDEQREGEENIEKEGEDADAVAEAETELEYNQPEQADQHLQDETNLELPEDLNIDGDKADMSDFSDAESNHGDEMADDDVEDQPDMTHETDVEMDDAKDEKEADEQGEGTAAEQDDQTGQQEDDHNSDIAMLEDQDDRLAPEDGLTMADDGHGYDEQEAAQNSGALSSAEQVDDNNDPSQPSTQHGTAAGANKSQQENVSGPPEADDGNSQTLPFKQLGDVLKEWFNQYRNIEAAKEDEDAKQERNKSADVSDARFEHTRDAETDMQAIGAGTTEQSKALDEKNAMQIEQTEDDISPKLEHSDIEMSDAEDEENGVGHADRAAEIGTSANKALIGTPANEYQQSDDTDPKARGMSPDEIFDVDEQMTKTHLSSDQQNSVGVEEARLVWSEHENRTKTMAIVLTEHLRLILQPTQATKMRGDFRTGKRLNIKKIIPYIASSYKRDKIWMRRSVPSKRSYQIMLAIDDSESMNESERKSLAFDTLALVARSMSMLEVGELCIIGFGESVNVNHDFSMPFTSDAGAEVIRQFSFSQTRTDVQKLLARSIELFREARLKATTSASNLWQLQLIISDGLCEDHPSIRQLVRQAHEERIMVVFIVVDATSTSTLHPSFKQSAKQSIVDLQRAEFVKDANGEAQINMVHYLDTFPFRHYLIVRDVRELPRVLAGALRQWFAEVVDSG